MLCIYLPTIKINLVDLLLSQLTHAVLLIAAMYTFIKRIYIYTNKQYYYYFDVGWEI